MEIKDKIVDFQYCLKCKHQLDKETSDPCDECLDIPVRDTEVPEYFEEAD